MDKFRALVKKTKKAPNAARSRKGRRKESPIESNRDKSPRQNRRSSKSPSTNDGKENLVSHSGSMFASKEVRSSESKSPLTGQSLSAISPSDREMDDLQPSLSLEITDGLGDGGNRHSSGRDSRSSLRKSKTKVNNRNSSSSVLNQLGVALVQGGPNDALLNQLGAAVPLLTGNHHEFQSVRPKLLLETLNQKAKAFVQEVSAVTIQRIIRGRKGRLRAQRQRLIISIKNQLSFTVTALLIDEICVGEVIDFCRELLGTEISVHEARRMENESMNRAVETIISNEMAHLIPLLVKEAIREEANAYLNRKKMAVQNPLLRLIFDLCDEVVDEMLPRVAEKAVEEEVNTFLVERRVVKAFGYLTEELFADIFVDLIDEAITESDFELGAESVIDTAIQELLREDVSRVLGELEGEKIRAVRQDDMRIIGEHLRNGVAKRMILGHLMISIANNFETVLLEHQSRCVVRRFIAHRLLQLVTEAGDAKASLQESSISREIFRALSMGPIQDMAVDALVQCAHAMMNDVDEQEEYLDKYRCEQEELGFTSIL
jgi:hypothetical protein